jgi:hypothetical protein
MADFSHYGGDADENLEIKKLSAEVVRTPLPLRIATSMQKRSLRSSHVI